MDLATFPSRAKEPTLDFEKVLRDLKRRAKMATALLRENEGGFDRGGGPGRGSAL